MDILQAIALAVLQGVTEFLPISSSAHLILLPVIVGWQDQGLAFDVAVHVGTLTAVTMYYRKDLAKLISSWCGSLVGKGFNDEAKLAWYVGLGTIPVGLVGISLSDAMQEALRNPLIIAAATIIFALLLWWAEKRARERRHTITLNDALLIGLFQALALIPGTSRSGITITAGLLLGLKREFAARYSFLLSIPVIALAGFLKALELYQSNVAVSWDLMLIGAGVSAIVAYLSIAWFLKLLNRIGMMPFVWYRLILGVVLIGIFSGQTQ
ncbi:MAG: undecaprenyl-diphosphate phosphatase [Methyloprofundus sp.]|uniref:undecaprenyl-diphosphate phosphatase n=1 Tax=Methyloprofundus sp. TaxID=2020875 RepID=UPI001A116284|nr:undecaprenyl-diphosphate phosphatase [Methyloprofundus sp.]HIL79075.1 undecaprenyl-diphosphate phosphatase [Methylococcales bacterium]